MFLLCIIKQSRATASDSSDARTELESDAKTVVVGRHADILNTSGRTAQVSPFTPDYEALKEVPIVDALDAYDCPYTNKLYILVFHNALSILSMNHNWTPLFIPREAGLHVNDTPKIKVKESTIDDHLI